MPWGHGADGMTKNSYPTDEAIRNLRKTAEALLPRAAMATTPLPRGTAEQQAAFDDLAHELRVHQIALEMQNEELRNTQLTLAETRDRYLDLFEFAPVGYLTLNDQGLVQEINLTATRMLGIPRARLLQRRMAAFVAPQDRDRWHRYYVRLKQGRDKLDCELHLLQQGGGEFAVRLSGARMALFDAPFAIRMTITDVSDAKQLAALNESNLRLRLAIEAMSGGLYDWDRLSNQVYWSSELKHVCGAHNGELSAGRAWWQENVHPEDLQRVRPLVRQVIKQRLPRFSVEYRIRTIDGRWIHVADRGWIERDAKGRISRLIGTLTDITLRKEAELACTRQNDMLEEQVVQRTSEVEVATRNLHEAVRFTRGVINSLSSRLCVLDENGRVVATNQAWREFTCSRCAKSVACGENPTAKDFYMACWSASEREQVQRAVAGLLAGQRTNYQFEYECDAGCEHWFEMVVTRFAGEGPIRLVARHDDITQRKQDELEQRRISERLKQLGGHLQTVREEQSALIARELHDELGATLTMLKLGLSAAADSGGGAAADSFYSSMIGLTDKALQATKRISSSLRPAMLDTLGLLATLRWYVRQFSETTGIRTMLRLPDYVRVADAANISTFRIIQEGLTNIAKHAGASRAWVHVSKCNGMLVVCISDNGSGIQPADMGRSDAFGIIGMRERAKYVAGELNIFRRPAGGTRLAFCVPLDCRNPEPSLSGGPI